MLLPSFPSSSPPLARMGHPLAPFTVVSVVPRCTALHGWRRRWPSSRTRTTTACRCSSRWHALHCLPRALIARSLFVDAPMRTRREHCARATGYPPHGSRGCSHAVRRLVSSRGCAHRLLRLRVGESRVAHCGRCASQRCRISRPSGNDRPPVTEGMIGTYTV